MTVPSPDPEIGLRVEERDGGVLLLTLDRPERLNAISTQVRDAFNAQLLAVEQGVRDCRTVVITGTGRAFCAGGDVKQFSEFFGHGPDVAYRNQMLFQEMCRLVWRLRVPVITAINGLALGGGTAVALMSDLRIAGESSVFGVGQVRRGLVPDVGLTYILPRIVGVARALEMMLLDRRVDAARALELGIVNRVVPDEEVLDAALELAAEIAALPAPAVAWIKRTTYLNLDQSFDEALNLEAMGEALLTGTPEFARSLDDFMKKSSSGT